jgi:hypothetical protein
MARLSPTVIAPNPSGEMAGAQDSNAQPTSVLIKQALSGGSITLLKGSSETGNYPGSSAGSVLIGDTDSFPTNNNGIPREKVDVQGAVRAFDFVLNNNGRRVGEVLEQLLPNAEVLSTTSSNQGASQNLSLNESANTRSGTINRSSGDLFSNSENQTNDPYETGIFNGQGAQGRIRGTLNFDKTGATGQYPNDAFTQGDTGELRLYVDGTLVDTADLTSTTSSINTTGGSGTNFGTDTGFVVDASDDVTFADGSATGNRYRTAQFQVVESSFGSFGLHTIEVVHFDPSTSSEIGDTNTAVFYYDPSVQDSGKDISITRQSTDGYDYGTVITSGSKTVSGVDYFTLASVETDIEVANLYYYTYDENGLTFDQLSNFDISAPTIPPPTSNYGEILNLTETGELGNGTNAPVVVGSSDDPGGQPSFQIDVDDETQGDPTPLTIQASRKFLVDSVTSQPNPDLQNGFINENRRVEETTGDFANVSPNYDNTASLSGTNELQVLGGRLVYPKGDFRNVSQGGNINYGPSNSGANYSNLTGPRSYIGYFTNTQSVANFALKIQGSGSMVDSTTSPLGTNQFTMQIRVGDESIADPSSGETGTGWLDVSEQFVTGNISDNDGAYNPDAGVNDNQTLDGTPIGITTQTKFTANHQDRMFYKITMGNASDVEIESIEVVWGGV